MPVPMFDFVENTDVHLVVFIRHEGGSIVAGRRYSAVEIIGCESPTELRYTSRNISYGRCVFLLVVLIVLLSQQSEKQLGQMEHGGETLQCLAGKKTNRKTF